MFTTPPIEDTVLLTFILIDTALLAACLFILLNTTKYILRGIRSLFRAARTTSYLSLLLAAIIVAIITLLYVRDQYLGLDDEPPPLELEENSLPQEGVNLNDLLSS